MIAESFRSPIFEGIAMNDAQFEHFSGILANLGVGLLLTGALGPAIIQAPLRFNLTMVVAGSWLFGVGFIFLSIYFRRT
jgi:hypothetical protein